MVTARTGAAAAPRAAAAARPAASPAAATPSSDADLPWLAAPLAEALATQRGHALLVHGPEGVGQFAFALGLARAWLCETPPADRPHGVLACGRCESCHLVAPDQVHPDLLVLMPEALHLALGWRRPGDGVSESATRKPSVWISIDQVRAAIDFSMLTRARGGAKVVVLHPAERMQPTAASALLKLLEEPAPGQRFVLACGDAAALMPTVRSRCHAVRLAPPGRDPAVAWLAARGLNGADAALLLDAAGGQPLAVLERHALGLDAALWRQLPAAVRQGSAAALGKLPVPLVVDALQKLCHDAMLAACGAPPRYFPPGAVTADAEVSRLADWAAELRRVARHAEHPWNAGLTVEALVQQGARALAPAGTAPTKADAARPARPATGG